MAITVSAPPRARLTSQGQITVPKSVRDELGAKPGDELEFEKTTDGYSLRRRRRVSVLDFAGIAAGSALGVPEAAEALDEMIRAGREELALAHERRISGLGPPVPQER